VITNARHRRGEVDMASRILDAGERLVQERGFNGFSYADIAAELHVTKAALHYHFAGKAELGEALIERYGARFAAALHALDAADLTATAKLEGYASLYLDVLQNQRMCMCGMLAAEYQTLPEGMRTAVIAFFDTNETWLELVVDQGQREGTLRTGQPSRDIARAIVGGLEGAMLIARPYGDVTRFQTAIRPLLAGLAAGATQELASGVDSAGAKRAATGRSRRTRRGEAG
jgi:TetR/AcrR family transcriptional regulator, transcriptional repressor for nem operon